MKKFRKNAYNLFIVFIVIFLIASLFCGTKLLDIQLYDSYISFPAYFLLGMVLFLYVIFYLLYRFLHNFLWSKYLTNTHILLTISILSVFAAEKIFFGFMSVDSYEPYGGFKKYHQQLLMLQSAGILFLVAQVLFIINVVVGIFLRKK